MTNASGDVPTTEPALRLEDLVRCYEGGVPAAICTADADGIPNVTYISRVHQVDEDRISLSNQFMSKTARNLAVNPVANLLLIDPITYQEYQLMCVYERTERRGPVFERLRHDVDQLAEEMGLRSVFKLRAADIFRVTSIERIQAPFDEIDALRPARTVEALAEFVVRVDRATDLEAVVDVAIDGLDRILGYRYASILLLDESGSTLYTIASRGFDDENVGAEVPLGDGPIGGPLGRCELHRTAGLRQISKYSRIVRQSFEESGVDSGPAVPVPGLADADSRLVVPMRHLGQLIGGIFVEERAAVAFEPIDEHILTAVAAVLGGAIESARAESARADSGEPLPDESVAASAIAPTDAVPGAAIRHFAADGSTFIDGEYLIKGVAGRILRALVVEHNATGRVDFTNRELRLDQSLDLPGFKDNLESRLILLKRRLDERAAPCRLEKTGRGRFRLVVDRPLSLDVIDGGPS